MGGLGQSEVPLIVRFDAFTHFGTKRQVNARVIAQRYVFEIVVPRGSPQRIRKVAEIVIVTKK
jgi:hypothetical protein